MDCVIVINFSDWQHRSSRFGVRRTGSEWLAFVLAVSGPVIAMIGLVMGINNLFVRTATKRLDVLAIAISLTSIAVFAFEVNWLLHNRPEC